MSNIKNYIFLHLTLLVYAISNIFSKIAANSPMLSFEFILNLGLLVLCLGVYAILWQQVLKKMDLTIAYANKGITVLWGLLISVIIFKDSITIYNILGCAIIIIGVVVMALGDKKHE